MPAEPELAPVGHDAFVDGVRALGEAIAAGGWTPTLIVGIVRGGLAPAVYLSHLTGIAMRALDPAAPDDLRHVAGRSRAGERLLLLDDINDSGHTFAALRAGLAAAGCDAGAIRAAALIDNIRSSERIDYRARAIDRTHDRRWFVFPWEAMAPRADLVADAMAVPGWIGAAAEDARRSP